MVSKWVTQICGIIVVLASALGIWGYFQNQKANSLIDEVNALVAQGNALVKEASPDYQKLFAEDLLQKFPGNRGELAALAQPAAAKFQRAAESYRQAATKLDESAQTSTKPIATQYWTLLAKANRKLAENKELAQKITLVFTDNSVASYDQLNSQLTPLAESLDQLSKEYDDLAAQADKLKADHPHDLR